MEDARKAMGLTSMHHARELVGKLRDALPGLVEVVRAGRRDLLRVRGVALLPMTPEHTVGACFAASLAPLFAGTSYARGMKSVLDAVVKVSPRAERFEDLDRRFLFLSGFVEPDLGKRAADLETLTRAVLDRRPMTFRYVSARSERSRSEHAEPWSVAIHESRLYVIGRGKRGAPWLWRFARMSEIKLGSRPFAYPTRREYDPARLFEHSFGVFLQEEEPEHVELLLAPRLARYLPAHQWHRSQKAFPGPNGYVRLTLRVKICPQLESWILSLGPDAEVLKPPRLRRSVIDKLGSAAALYRRSAVAVGTGSQ